MSCAIFYSVASICEGANGSIILGALHPYVFFCEMVTLCINFGKFSTRRSIKESTLTWFSHFKLSFWLNKLHHGCFHSHLWKSQWQLKKFSVKKFLNSIVDAFIMVFPYFKNSYRLASDMTCFTDIYLRVKRTEHKLGIRYFVICAKADWWHRLNLF